MTNRPGDAGDLMRELRRLKKHYGAEDFEVVELDDDDPVLRAVDGTVVDTWRQNYPYETRLTTAEYERDKRLLQIELLKLQRWSATSNTCRRPAR